MNKVSIKFRVTLWYTLVMICISAVTLIATTSVSQKIFKNDLTEKLIGTVNDTARMIEGGPRGEIKKMPGSHFFEKGVHVAIYDSNREIIGGYMPFDFIDEIEFFDNGQREINYNGEKFITYTRRIYYSPNGEIQILGVVSLTNESQMFQSVMKTNLILVAVLILAAAIGGYLIIKNAFKPVDAISRTAKEISESSDLTQRIGLGNGKDEIYRLGNTFDEMLDKIEKTLEIEKQFTSDASHELRTPVAVINSECEYVLDCAENLDDVKESVQSIKLQADKMSKLISELLTISRMDKNTQYLNFEDVDISELVNFVCDEQEEINKGCIKLKREIESGIIVKADRFMLARLFINLINNAYKYGKENGNIAVFVSNDSDIVTVRVKDDGIGIAEENLPKIWERFYQVNPARTNEDNSMGLGLPMVKWIANCHGGKIEVESELGKGTEFTFTMPVK
ncbi:MAG: HAMP domain-containing histidine kinase [Clostridia bacterium]|nr:HAMP domain-containing histidine kinase [Clostridia bacterium]